MEWNSDAASACPTRGGLPVSGQEPRARLIPHATEVRCKAASSLAPVRRCIDRPVQPTVEVVLHGDSHARARVLPRLLHRRAEACWFVTYFQSGKRLVRVTEAAVEAKR